MKTPQANSGTLSDVEKCAVEHAILRKTI